MVADILTTLLRSPDPAIRFKARILLGEDTQAPEMQLARQEVRNSPVVQALLSEVDTEGRIPHHPYSKWDGAHWVLACLAELGYPTGDERLCPLLNQAIEWILSPEYWQYIKPIAGRVRRCASQEGNILWYALTLELAGSAGQDHRGIDQLVERLLAWQWPDGGWNCDKRPEVAISSFMETLIPLRALACYARISGEAAAKEAAGRAAEIFLKRQLFKRQRDGQVMDEHFVQLHYPCYWHYDALFGLKVMAEAGLLGDPRCQAALDWLETKRLPGGGFPAEKAYYRCTSPGQSGYSRANWGGTSGRRMNEFVTVEALNVLKAAGRFNP